ncbi:Inosine/uridine-preferring nucleoside hydrolase [Isoptericola variabilis 225]|uniref:Inosine/uridine-preferring nucleoside hydrolase n=2 Tax=Isoptericola TaxID=254250 RepID=F6FW03_ISOV2|nr:Inosine/uridine-preferring nucleoside hydrolase [Isoptericola variabilis 225]
MEQPLTRIPHPADRQAGPTKRWRLGESPWRTTPFPAPRSRVIIDNDFSGDPDDLFQLVHHLLSPSVEIPLVVASHLRPDDPMDPGPDTAANAHAVLEDLFARMGLESTERIYRGASQAMTDTATPQDSPAARAIIAEAMRDDVATPLFYAAGGGLTDLASAYLLEPRIAQRLTLIWIGGPEHDGLAIPPVDAMPIEYNLLIDVPAARVLFDAQDLTIWQVPRNVYRQCLVSDVELRRRVATCGDLGTYLYEEVAYEQQRVHEYGLEVCESYALGDSPLVLLTALRSTFEADSSSSFYVERPTPQLTAEGAYRTVRGSRPMRVYTQVDVRLMFEDFFLKLDEFARWQADS